MIILAGDQLALCACNCCLLTSVKVQVTIYFLTAINKQLQIAIIMNAGQLGLESSRLESSRPGSTRPGYIL